MLLLYMMTNFL